MPFFIIVFVDGEKTPIAAAAAVNNTELKCFSDRMFLST